MFNHLSRIGNIDYARCERCGARIDPDQGWYRGDYGEWICGECKDQEQEEENDE